MRDFKSSVENTDGKLVSFNFRAIIWHFSVVEVLKASDDIPAGEIEVVASTQSKYYMSTRQFHKNGTTMRVSFASNMTDYVRDVSGLGNRNAILFLLPPMNPEYFSRDPLFEVAGQAYPLAADPGMEDPELKGDVLELLE